MSKRVRIPVHPTFDFKECEVEQSISERFERIVDRYPDHIAVGTKQEFISYRVLNSWANRIAHKILDERKQSTETVAIVMDQGAELVATIYGVLKAGKHYVPLDPEYPKVRIQYMLEDSEASLIITDAANRLFARELGTDRISIIMIDNLDVSIPDHNPSHSTCADDLAYILYTSGSTGRPKGVMQTHRNLLFDMRRQSRDLGVAPSDRFGLLFSVCYSAAACHIFGALLNGASLFPIDLKRLGISYLKSWLIDNRISVLDIGVTTFRHFATTLNGDERFEQLRILALGGEAMYARDALLYKRLFEPHCILQNALGTTEARTFVQFFMNHQTEIDGTQIPVGYPDKEKEIMLLDEAGNLVELGEPGEIAVRSRYLSPGYWDDKVRSDAVFLPDPDGGHRRIYKTGDLGKWLPSGALLHLGRKDFQVKIRGFRIEVAEIESVLAKHPSIQEAVVTAESDSNSELHLVAYLILADNGRPRTLELQEYLLKYLPQYMLPSIYWKLKRLPLTPNGKLDRRALAKQKREKLSVDCISSVATTNAEERMIAIWKEVLEIETIETSNNFLELGGDSLKASQVIVRLNQEYDTQVTVRNLFEHLQFSEFAAFIDEISG